MPRLNSKQPVYIFRLSRSTHSLSLALCKVSAGFPSPADDYIEGRINFDDLLIKNKPATYLMRVTGESMIGAGIYSNDLMVVDRSLKPAHNKLVVACIEGEFTLKRFCIQSGKIVLKAENKNYSDIEINNEEEFSVFGVVTAIVRTF